ncbi:hypothetical protein L1987_08667 [Smallanthus sonchifolius]|uniref:Uncharacterized protein n=1 Tax=Smallanthus sonchifolius TaxID=185202 RepID=A0ACB9JMY2_9ASTR|nr:hypothetical protein L1987_08667 [Smallanthus sonchifolius]
MFSNNDSPFTFNLKPIFLLFLPKTSMALYSVAFHHQQSIRNQTAVSVTLSTHLLSKKFPNSNTVKVANEVNSWAEKHTNGLIKNVLDANAIDSLTWVIFANAVNEEGTEVAVALEEMMFGAAPGYESSSKVLEA